MLNFLYVHHVDLREPAKPAPLPPSPEAQARMDEAEKTFREPMEMAQAEMGRLQGRLDELTSQKDILARNCVEELRGLIAKDQALVARRDELLQGKQETAARLEATAAAVHDWHVKGVGGVVGSLIVKKAERQRAYDELVAAKASIEDLRQQRSQLQQQIDQVKRDIAVRRTLVMQGRSGADIEKAIVETQAALTAQRDAFDRLVTARQRRIATPR